MTKYLLGSLATVPVWLFHLSCELTLVFPSKNANLALCSPLCILSLKVVVVKAIIPIHLWQECNAHDINGVLWDLMKETPPVFFWWGRIRIWQLEAMFNSKPEQFEYFFSASNGILYSFSDLKPSGFFDLPNIAGGNNFHQINRRNLLILPGGPPGLEGNGKPLSDTRFLSLLFLFILPP